MPTEKTISNNNLWHRSAVPGESKQSQLLNVFGGFSFLICHPRRLIGDVTFCGEGNKKRTINDINLRVKSDRRHVPRKTIMSLLHIALDFCYNCHAGGSTSSDRSIRYTSMPEFCESGAAVVSISEICHFILSAVLFQIFQAGIADAIVCSLK